MAKLPELAALTTLRFTALIKQPLAILALSAALLATWKVWPSREEEGVRHPGGHPSDGALDAPRKSVAPEDKTGRPLGKASREDRIANSLVANTLTPEEALQSFFSAPDLNQRLSFITGSRRSKSELEQSCLARPLPAVKLQRPLQYMTDGASLFYEVQFDRKLNEQPLPIIINVQQGPNGSHVHADAFIDLFEHQVGPSELSPSNEPVTLHVIGDFYMRTYDDSIPDAGAKSFLKLRAHPRTRPFMIAHFTTDSPLRDQISDPVGLAWGQSGVVTVTVQPNTETSGKPFMELIEIQSFDWLP